MHTERELLNFSCGAMLHNFKLGLVRRFRDYNRKKITNCVETLIAIWHDPQMPPYNVALSTVSSATICTENLSHHRSYTRLSSSFIAVSCFCGKLCSRIFAS
jgi:hypothetical protein